MDTEAVKIFEEMSALTAGKSANQCATASAELLVANLCVLWDSPEEAKAHLREMRDELLQSIDENFDHYHAQLDKEADLFGPGADEDRVEEDATPEEAALPAPVLPEEPLAGWPRARALRDVADYLASCRDSGEQIAIGCIYPWMRDLTVETLRTVSEALTAETVANWDAKLGIAAEPDLLEALRALAEDQATARWQNAPHDLLRNARAAIAKAGG
jgi:hypothetical protein